MEYEQPIRFPSDDPNRLFILLAGRQVPYWEANRWYSVFYGRRKLLPLVAFVMCLLYALITVSFAAVMARSVTERQAAVWIVAAAVTVLSFFLFFTISHLKRIARRYMAVYDADTKRHLYGTRMAIYTDRLEFSTLRGTKICYFTEIDRCLETYDGFALLTGDDCLIIRSADLTPYDAQLLREYLTERLSPSVMCCKTPAQPQLAEPLPIPHFQAETTVYTTASVAVSHTAPYRYETRTRFFLLLMTALPLSLLFGVMLSAFFSITGNALRDLVIFCGGSVLGGAVIGVLLFRLFYKKSDETLKLAFEPDGLRLTTASAEWFVIKERLWLSANEQGVTVRFFNQQTLFIPKEACSDFSVLKALAGII